MIIFTILIAYFNLVISSILKLPEYYTICICILNAAIIIAFAIKENNDK